jgi:YVTN family beta-propeller protein
MTRKIQTKYMLSCLLLLLPTYSCTVQHNTVIATINVGVTPAGLAITPDSHYAYVANNNNYDIPCKDNVSVLNLHHNTVQTTINHYSFNQPYTVTLNADGSKAYVTNSNSSTITIIDTASNTVIGVIGGFDGPSGMVITPDGNTAYVNNYGGPEGVGSGNGTTVSVVNLNTNSVVGSPITVGLAPAALAMTPDGQFVYVANYVDGNQGTGTISVIRTSDNTVVSTINGFFGPFAIAITPNGKYALVTNFGSNNFAPIGTTVDMIKLSNNTIHKTFTLGIQPSGLAITPNSRLAYVSNYNTLYADGQNFTGLTAGQGTINIIDIHAKKLKNITIPVDQSPDAIAISPNGKYAYVSNYTSNTVNVIAIPQ